MLAAVRRFAKSPYAAVLLVLLIISFAVFGIQDVFNGRVSQWVIKAGSRTMDSAEFKRNFDGFKGQAEQQAQRPLTVEELAAQGMDRQVLSDMAARESMAEWLYRAGVRPSDKLIAAELRKSTALFDPVTGKFDQAVYQSRLAENGLTPEKYEGLLRDDIATSQFFAGLAGGFRAPRIYTALAAAYALESRDLSYLVVTPQMVGQIAPPTDAELTKFMNDNKAQLMRPEFRVLSIVRFDPKAAVAAFTADPAKIQERFDFRKDSLSSPETRSIVQIAVTAQQAATVADRLRKGEEPALIAKSIGKEAVIINDRPKTALPDRKIADAAFAMKDGEVSGAIAGDLGTAVVKVTKVTPAIVASLDQHREAIIAELRNEAGLEKVDQQTQAYEEAHNAGSNLLEAAAKAGATTFTVGPVTKEGGALPGAPTAGLNPKILEAAFALSSGGESDVTDAGQGEYFAVRVDRIIPPALPALADVRTDLARVYVQRKQLEAMTTRAEALAERARKGEAMSAIAASAGAQLQTAGGLDRLRAQQNQVLGGDILGKAFGAKTGEVFVARTPQFGMAVAKVDAVKPGPTAMVAQATAMQERPTSEALFRTLGEAARLEAVRKLKTKTNIERAKLAIGLDPKAATGPAGAPEAGK